MIHFFNKVIFSLLSVVAIKNLHSDSIIINNLVVSNYSIDIEMKKSDDTVDIVLSQDLEIKLGNVVHAAKKGTPIKILNIGKDVYQLIEYKFVNSGIVSVGENAVSIEKGSIIKFSYLEHRFHSWSFQINKSLTYKNPNNTEFQLCENSIVSIYYNNLLKSGVINSNYSFIMNNIAFNVMPYSLLEFYENGILRSGVVSSPFQITFPHFITMVNRGSTLIFDNTTKMIAMLSDFPIKITSNHKQIQITSKNNNRYFFDAAKIEGEITELSKITLGNSEILLPEGALYQFMTSDLFSSEMFILRSQNQSFQIKTTFGTFDILNHFDIVYTPGKIEENVFVGEDTIFPILNTEFKLRRGDSLTFFDKNKVKVYFKDGQVEKHSKTSFLCRTYATFYENGNIHSSYPNDNIQYKLNKKSILISSNWPVVFYRSGEIASFAEIENNIEYYTYVTKIGNRIGRILIFNDSYTNDVLTISNSSMTYEIKRNFHNGFFSTKDKNDVWYNFFFTDAFWIDDTKKYILEKEITPIWISFAIINGKAEGVSVLPFEKIN